MIEMSVAARAVLGAVLVVYLVLLLALSLYASRKVQNEEDYLVAGRRLPLFLAWATLIATWFGAATMTGAAEAARADGLRGVILDPFACAGTLVLAGLFFAKPLWRLKLLTVADLFRRLYGVRSEVLASSVQVPAYFGWIAAQYIALAAVQHVYFDIPVGYGIVIAVAVTLLYTLLGGMWSVTLTDAAQIVVALGALVVLAEAALSDLGGGSFLGGLDRLLAESNPEHLTLLPAAGTAAAFVWVGDWASGLLGNIPAQDLQQRVFASRDERTAALACILAGVLYLAFGMIPVSLGIASNLTDPGELEGKTLQLLAGKYLGNVTSLLFVVAFVSLVVSTATSAVLAPATVLAHNLLGRLPIFKGRMLGLDRVCVLLISMGAMWLAFQGHSIMELLDLSLSIAMVGLFVPLLMGLYGRPRGELPAILATGCGVAVFFPRLLLEATFAGEAIAARIAASSAWSEKLIEAYLVVSPDLQGLLASFAGYFVGQALLRGRPPINTEIRAMAFPTKTAEPPAPNQ